VSASVRDSRIRNGWPGRVPCPWADCWCKAEPHPRREVVSIGMGYTMTETEPGLYVYTYFPLEARAC
jgi:hypothetical protein